MSDRSETFTAKERAAIRCLLEELDKRSGGEEDAVGLIIKTPGVCDALGVEVKSPSGLYRMVRHDAAIHTFLRKIYDPS